MTDLQTLRDQLVGIRGQTQSAIDSVDRLIERVKAAEEAEAEPQAKSRPATLGSGR